jgi:hypothetical protein
MTAPLVREDALARTRGLWVSELPRPAGLAASILWVAAEGRAATDVLVNNYDDFRPARI